MSSIGPMRPDGSNTPADTPGPDHVPPVVPVTQAPRSTGPDRSQRLAGAVQLAMGTGDTLTAIVADAFPQAFCTVTENVPLLALLTVTTALVSVVSSPGPVHRIWKGAVPAKTMPRSKDWPSQY